MQLALNQLPGHLAQGLRPLYTLHGDEPLQLQEAADAIRAAARAAGFTERSVFTVQGAHFDWSAVLAAGSALSLFADKQIIELRIPSGKPGGKEGAAALAQLAQHARRVGQPEHGAQQRQPEQAAPQGLAGALHTMISVAAGAGGCCAGGRFGSNSSATYSCE